MCQHTHQISLHYIIISIFIQLVWLKLHISKHEIQTVRGVLEKHDPYNEIFMYWLNSYPGETCLEKIFSNSLQFQTVADKITQFESHPRALLLHPSFYWFLSVLSVMSPCYLCIME